MKGPTRPLALSGPRHSELLALLDRVEREATKRYLGGNAAEFDHILSGTRELVATLVSARDEAAEFAAAVAIDVLLDMLEQAPPAKRVNVRALNLKAPRANASPAAHEAFAWTALRRARRHIDPSLYRRVVRDVSKRRDARRQTYRPRPRTAARSARQSSLRTGRYSASRGSPPADPEDPDAPLDRAAAGGAR